MKRTATLVVFLSFILFGWAQNTTQNLFSYIDKSGNKISVDLSILPSFLDSNFLKNNVCFEWRSDSLRYRIEEFNVAKNVKEANLKHHTALNETKATQVVFLRVYGSRPLKQPETLDDVIGSWGIEDFILVIKRTAKRNWLM